MKATQKIISPNAITIDGIEYPAKYTELPIEYKDGKLSGGILVLYGENFSNFYVFSMDDFDFERALTAAWYAAAAERGDSEKMKQHADELKYYYNGEPEPEPEEPKKPGILSAIAKFFSMIFSVLYAIYSYELPIGGKKEEEADEAAEDEDESAQPAEAAKVEAEQPTAKRPAQSAKPEQPAAQTDAPEQPLDLRREVVAFTGRLSAMTRDEAIKAVRKCGGKAYEDLTTACTVLVVGARPGRRKLDKAARWHGLRQISEAAFLSALKAAKQPVPAKAKRPAAKAAKSAASRPVAKAAKSSADRIVYAPDAVYVGGKRYAAKYSELGSFVQISYDGKKVSIGPDHPDYVPAGLAASAALFEELGEPDQVRRFTDSLASHYAGDRQERAAA